MYIVSWWTFYIQSLKTTNQLPLLSFPQAPPFVIPGGAALRHSRRLLSGIQLLALAFESV